MEIVGKSGAIIGSGKITSAGATTREVGSTQKMSFGVKTGSTKDANGEWVNSFRNCALWGAAITEFGNDLAAGDTILFSGRCESRQYQDRNGENRTVNEVRCDFVLNISKIAEDSDRAIPPTPATAPVFAEYNANDDEFPF